MTLAAVIGTDHLAEVWVSWMVHMSWQVALLAGIAWLLSAVFRRSSAGLRYTLWLLVFVKLVVPPWWATPWSAGTVLARLPVTVGGERISQVDYGRWAVGDSRRAEQDAPVAGPDGRRSEPTGAGRYVADGARSSAASAAMAVWALVAGAVGTVLLAQWLAYARRVTRSATPAPPPVHEALRRQRDALGVRRPVRVCVSDAVTTPGVAVSVSVFPGKQRVFGSQDQE